MGGGGGRTGVAGPDIGAAATPTKTRAWGGGGIWHKASVSDCLPLAAPTGLSPLPVGPNMFWLCQRSPWMTCPV